ncbi:MAG: hypothetical protein NZ480_09530 [Bdellovibrionaceae bacterium]|nr:hypothetical protein [Pseudobdellovibrionaceae bacterium]MDW8189860.1 hypothetical protein [Pseudobdellovibrionaceae bacterium]
MKFGYRIKSMLFKRKKYLLNIRSQVKYAIIFGGLFFLGNVFFVVITYFTMTYQVTLWMSGQSPQGLNFFMKPANFVWTLTIFSLFASIVIGYLFIVVSHRYLGPLIPVLRSLKAYFQNQEVVEIRIRQTDELQEFVNDLNLELRKRGEDAPSS